MLENININVLSKREQLAFYARINNNYINMEAIFSDETENYVSPCEPLNDEPVNIKIRTAKNNIDRVFFVLGLDEDCEKTEIFVCDSDEYFDYYSYNFKCIEKEIKYYFELVKGEKVYYYNRFGLQNRLLSEFSFKIIPNWKTPQWSKSAVMYQIYVDRFFNGDKKNDVINNEYKYLGAPVKKLEWEKPVEARDVCNHYGGDLQGILDKLEYLKELGVEVLYLNPIFVSPSNHKYDIQDYDYIDPHFAKIIKDDGEALYFEKFNNEYATKYISRTTDKENLEASNEFFAEFIKECHKNNIRVIIDGVFNHCGAFNKWLDKEHFYEKNGYVAGAYSSEKSDYHNFFVWTNDKADTWPDNENYSSWWGHDNHPKLNLENSKELENYILEIGKKWVSEPYNVDGWRLDVGADLGNTSEYNHSFWKKFRNAVKNGNNESIIISEHYGDASSWLAGDEWDTIMNYDAFMEPVTWFLTGMEKHSDSHDPYALNNSENFYNAMLYNMNKFTIQSLNTAMNQLSNHDHSRFLTRTNMTAGRIHNSGREMASKNIKLEIMYEAIVIQMTWPGSPSLYYGDEVGLVGWTDPDNRRTFPWGKENNTLKNFYKKAIEIHKNNSALRYGSITKLCLDYGILSYGRWDKDNSIVVVINNNEEYKKVLLPIWKIAKKNSGILEVLLESNKNGYLIGENEIIYKNGYVELNLCPRSSMILKEKI
ncbi:MAG: glycoside hydrolase family 13 protein [Lachnospirales bacterium]